MIALDCCLLFVQGSETPSPSTKRRRKEAESEEGEDGQQGAGKKPKLLPPTADGVENSSPESGAVASGGAVEGSSAKKRRLTSDSFMVGAFKSIILYRRSRIFRRLIFFT